MNVFDWFSGMPLSPFDRFPMIEVSFKKGMRKGFYRNTHQLDLVRGQLVVVESSQGYDIGEVALQGELVRAQMKKKKVTERDDTIRSVVRVAAEEDINQFLDFRNKEKNLMIRARAIAKTLDLNMKIGDVEFQGDGKKLTVYYIADDRVDFRELVKVFARDFKVKIEMRQIGARQEASRIGGVGTCGRELCCSTWLTDFKSVNTASIRYQHLSLNTDKMSGQCGRLKCCLNYELDTYNDALKKFPRHADKIETEAGIAFLRKTEILKGTMCYAYADQPGNLIRIPLESVKELLWMLKNGKKPQSLENFAEVVEVKDESKHDDLVGQVSLKTLENKDRKRRRDHQKKKGPQQKRTDSGHKRDNEPASANRPPQPGGNKPQTPRPGGNSSSSRPGGQQGKHYGKGTKRPSSGQGGSRKPDGPPAPPAS